MLFAGEAVQCRKTEAKAVALLPRTHVAAYSPD